MRSHCFNMTNDQYRLFTQPTAIISIALSSTVVITAILFPSMIRHKVFMEIIVLLLCCDILGNWPYTLGYYPGTSSALCKFSGFCNLFFFPCTWLYTAALAVNLHGLVFYRKAILVQGSLHAIVLGIPLVFTLCILATNSYGKPGHGQGVCSLAGDAYDSKLWHYVTYYGLLLLCLLVMILMMGHLRYLECARSPLVSLQSYQTARRFLLLYPILLGFCWLPHTVIGYLNNSTSTYKQYSLGPICDVLKISHGAFVAITFFCNSKEARLRWSILFRNFYTQSLFGLLIKPKGEEAPTKYLGESEYLSSVIISDMMSDEIVSERLRMESSAAEILSLQSSTTMNSEFSNYSTASSPFGVSPQLSVKSYFSSRSASSVSKDARMVSVPTEFGPSEVPDAL